MSEKFIEGDVLLYFNLERTYIVMLDKIETDYFVVVTSQDSKYEYGFKIKIKNLTNKYFLKIDVDFEKVPGAWEEYAFS